MMARKKVERKVTEDPRYHNTWKLLRKYRDVVWSLELSVQQVRTQFQIEYDTSIEDFLESIYLAGADLGGTDIEHQAQCIERSHNISVRTYYRRRKEAIEALSSVLWGYTAQDSLQILEQFFPAEAGGR